MGLYFHYKQVYLDGITGPVRFNEMAREEKSNWKFNNSFKKVRVTKSKYPSILSFVIKSLALYSRDR